MKNYFIYAFLLIVLCSCNKEEDDSIVGTYKMTSLSQLDCINSAENFELDFGNNNCTTAAGIEFCESGTFNFSADGNFTSTIRLTTPALGDIFDLNGRGTYVANGNIATICFPDCSDFTLSGKSLTLNIISGGCTQRVVFTKN